MGLAGFETGRSASEDAAGPPPASPVSRSRSGGAALGSAGKPPLGGGRLRSSLSDGSDAADEDPRCLIRNLDDGREYVVREEFGLREVGTGLRSIRCAAGSLVTHSRDRRSRDEKDTSSEKGGQHSSSATDDSQDSVPRHGPARVKVRQYGKSHKELSGLFMTQQIQAHNGSIWSIKFSPDGRYLASAGEDCIIHVWEVLEFERAGKEREVKENGVCNPLVAMVCNESSETMVASAAPSGSHWEKKLRSKVLHSGGSVSSDRLMVPEYVFALSEKPVITFAGHSEDVLDLSWSKSQESVLITSQATLYSNTLKAYADSQTPCTAFLFFFLLVTCIQFNPVDDRYFISGSLDEKVRIWSIPKREIVDWVDLHEMVTAACYTPDGKKIKKTASYATEVTAFIEKGKLGKITGVKIKELMLWISIVEVYVPEASPEKVTSKSSSGLSKTLDAAAFALGNEGSPNETENYGHVKSKAGLMLKTTMLHDLI
ncbi:unnamed protein product [Miscanthus lutarioriparius]|uniref:Transducin/WD40 repeat-like superfamily protein n=1 Tax=Miscanthus lutarioriparius TaxID=422564 RepID=A0A811NH03_9POAL|nr:unnamed protein product [Miscanthus lutarioriparius]